MMKKYLLNCLFYFFVITFYYFVTMGINEILSVSECSPMKEVFLDKVYSTLRFTPIAGFVFLLFDRIKAKYIPTANTEKASNFIFHLLMAVMLLWTVYIMFIKNLCN